MVAVGLELSGKQFWLRADMRAIKAAKDEHGIDIANMGEDIVELATLVYFFAKSGGKAKGAPFDYDLDGFLELVDVSDFEALSEVLAKLMGNDGKKK